MEPLTLTRSIQLDADTSRVWDLIATADGLASWLADAVDVTVRPGAAGVVLDGGAERRIVVTDVEEGRRVGFTWWSEEEPELASSVSISITADGDGSRITVVETLDPALAGGRMVDLAQASVGDLGSSDAAWSDRLARLLGATVPVPAARA